jgi:hypothetical protein
MCGHGLSIGAPEGPPISGGGGASDDDVNDWFDAFLFVAPELVFVELALHQFQAEGDDGGVVEVADAGNQVGDDVNGIEHVEEGESGGADGPVGDFAVGAFGVVFDQGEHEFALLHPLAEFGEFVLDVPGAVLDPANVDISVIGGGGGIVRHDSNRWTHGAGVCSIGIQGGEGFGRKRR